MKDDTRKFFEKLAGVNNDNEEKENEKEDIAAEFEPKLVKARPSAERAAGEIVALGEEPDIFSETEGVLAIDVYQTDNDIIIEAPIAGINADDLDIDINPESVSIKGKREGFKKEEGKNYLLQECYWGRFSRSIILPQEINPDHASANFKNGVLRIVLPKLDRKKSKKMKVKFE